MEFQGGKGTKGTTTLKSLFSAADFIHKKICHQVVTFMECMQSPPGTVRQQMALSLGSCGEFSRVSIGLLWGYANPILETHFTMIGETEEQTLVGLPDGDSTLGGECVVAAVNRNDHKIMCYHSCSTSVETIPKFREVNRPTRTPLCWLLSASLCKKRSST